MLKVKVNYPDDMTEVYKKIAKFQAKKIKKECTPTEINAVIKYLENLENKC